MVDQKETTFGIRTVGFDATNGFLLNGKHYEIYGTCNHQDHAGVGAAIPDALQEFRVKKLKEFGCNAIRTSHNPPTPELLDACDRLGMLVMDESRLMGSDSANLKKWDDQIRRDRNHPSVAIWCIANEQFAVQDTPQAANVARTMQDYVKQLDPTRPVTYASPEGDVFRGINSVIEVRGWNYHYGPRHGPISRRASEPAERRHRAGQRRRHARHLRKRRGARLRQPPTTWSGRAGPRPPKAGGVSSPTARGFPARSSGRVLIIAASRRRIGGRASTRTSAFSTPAVFRRTFFTTTNRGGRRTPCCTCCRIGTGPARKARKSSWRRSAIANRWNCFLNGASLGKQTMKPNSKLSWKVKYAPGTLSAKGFDAAGNVIAETKVETTGDAAQIQLTPDRKTINADGEDVAVFTVSALDAQGRVVPVAQNKINFAIEGAGKIIGVGNGDPSCHEPDVFVPTAPAHNIAVDNWRWEIANIPKNRSALPEYAQ